MPLASPLPQPQDSSLTTLLQALQEGGEDSFQRLFEQAYEELKKIARQRVAQQGSDCSLVPTELLHDAILRVMDAPMVWQNRAHFFASMSLYLRAVIVDNARARRADKRGGGAVHLTLSNLEVGAESGVADLLALDSALKHLETLDRRSSEVLHLTYFAGLNREEIADVLKVSLPTVVRDLRFAKSWLNRQMGYAL